MRLPPMGHCNKVVSPSMRLIANAVSLVLFAAVYALANASWFSSVLVPLVLVPLMLHFVLACVCISTVPHDAHGYEVRRVFRNFISEVWGWWTLPLVSVAIAYAEGRLDFKTAFSTFLFGETMLYAFFDMKALGFAIINTTVYNGSSVGYKVSCALSFVLFYVFSFEPIWIRFLSAKGNS